MKKALSVAFLFFSIIAIVTVICALGVVLPITSSLRRTPVPLPTYAPATVREVCALFVIDSDDAFCRESSRQDARDLEWMLLRNYPIGITTFDEIMPLLSALPSISSEMDFQGRNSEPGGCILPEELPKGYEECMIFFPGEIGRIEITFDDTNTVIDYGVLGSGGGGS